MTPSRGGIRMYAPAVAPRIVKLARRLAAVCALMAVMTPSALLAQKWQEIGKTAPGSVVLIDGKSVKRLNDSVTVTMRTRFVKADGEGITGARTIATFN